MALMVPVKPAVGADSVRGAAATTAGVLLGASGGGGAGSRLEWLCVVTGAVVDEDGAVGVGLERPRLDAVLLVTVDAVCVAGVVVAGPEQAPRATAAARQSPTSPGRRLAQSGSSTTRQL